MKKLYLLLLLFASVKLLGNNVQINNLSIVGDDPINGYAFVQFDLSWDNSWRSEENWDAVWLFVKYRANNGEWRHAWLNNTGNNDGSGTNAVMDIGLKNDKIPYDDTTNPGIGCMVYRSTTGSGPFFVTSMQLRWNYRANGVFSSTGIELKVFAIEMVLVPGGPFWVGDGGDFVNKGSFRKVESNTPVEITATSTVIKCQNSFYDDAQLEGSGIWIDGDEGISRSAATATDINPDYPTGFRGYYCMKYEISQGQYRDFLNTLTRIQQNARTASDILGTNVTNRYIMSNTENMINRNGLRCDGILTSDDPIEIYCDLNGNGIKNEVFDGEWIACNFLSWDDGVAFSDWCGLRPMTELEFEKTCRGPLTPITNEYAWGTTGAANTSYSLSFAGTAFEGISTGYSTNVGNANIPATRDSIYGPVRVGIFSANSLNNNRISSGSGYYGAMELTGNVVERTVTLGNYPGRTYTGLHGDGNLGENGSANVSFWPGGQSFGGSGIRGGSWSIGSFDLFISGRELSSVSLNTSRQSHNGFRGCRSVPPSGNGY